MIKIRQMYFQKCMSSILQHGIERKSIFSQSFKWFALTQSHTVYSLPSSHKHATVNSFMA
jgi:hypothetical protein